MLTQETALDVTNAEVNIPYFRERGKRWETLKCANNYWSMIKSNTLNDYFASKSFKMLKRLCLVFFENDIDIT